MSKLWLSERMISTVFWEALRSSIYFKEAQHDAELIATATAPLVDKFPSIAGSISIKSSTYLWLLTKYFSPKNVLEIGTYIGRSTLAINFGGLYSIERFWTCDGTFDCMNFNDLKTTGFSEEKSKSVRKIEYYGKTMSTELLKKSMDINTKFDFIFVDGRLSGDDCNILPKVMSDSCIILLDDFEGVEKGVVNVMMLRNMLKGFILIEPPIENDAKLGNLALLVPPNLITLARQQSLPVNM